MIVRKGPKHQDRAGRLMAATLPEKLRKHHPTPGGPFRHHWKKHGVNLTSSVFMTVGDADTHPGRFSLFKSHVVRQRVHVHASAWTSDRLGDDFWVFPYFCTMRGSTLDSDTYVSPEVPDNFHIFIRESIWEMTSREDRPRIRKSMCCLPCLAVSLSLSSSGCTTGIVMCSGDGVSQTALIHKGYPLFVMLRLHLAGLDPAVYPLKIFTWRGTFSPSPWCRAC